MSKCVVGLGEILWDVLPTGKVLGGAPANFAWHISRFGYDGLAVSATGRDKLGDEIVSVLADKELDSLIERVDFPTGTVQVTLDKAGVPEYEICEGVAWDNIPFTPAAHALARRTDAVCFGSLAQRSPVSRLTIRRFLEAMPADSLKIFDINLRQHFYSREQIASSLEMATALKLNDDEVAVLGPMFDIEGDGDEVCRRLLDIHCLDLVILTCGSTGSLVFSRGGGVSHLPTPRVRVVDTVGAGDSFTAAFFAGWMAGWPVSRAHELAVEVAAYVCTQPGAMPSLPASFTAPF